MTFIDIVIIIAVLFIAAFAVEMILIKVLNIPIRESRFINDQHKKRYKQFLIIYGVVMLVMFIFYILQMIIVFIPLTLVILYPVLSALVDMVMEIKYAPENRRYIISISNIAVYISFLVMLFTTDLFGLVG
ncbi:DUF4181 domain-containing protein [Filobacillus milosensis]|uniref:DUF4181 domain-containing protein n=1 Tax=Filobacillus milosensis TaxID=94137 RepID=A0A4Y8INA5_9BACI|nr:DUF4181 domain-containing protein [Filobacillus milosensis]TFB22821.1 DUF4181 domain-containing protein [Filobacillus milosensis]